VSRANIADSASVATKRFRAWTPAALSTSALTRRSA
jgi:hypothetical protein